VDSPNYERLNVWQDAMSLVKTVYILTKDFPRDEIHSLTNQIRRAAVSVPANIAEGHGRGTKKDFRQFLYISKGSLQELNTLTQLANEIGYLKDTDFIELRASILSLVRRITALSKNLVPPT